MMRFWQYSGHRKFVLPLFALASVILATSGAYAAEERMVTVKEFQETIAKRDKIIIDLLRRVKGLEARLSDGVGLISPKKTAPNPAEPTRKSLPELTPPAALTAQKSPAPGRIVVDELTAQRALERSLVETGALLLAPGQAEISPSFTFQHNDAGDATAISGFVANRSIRRDTFDAALAFRHGLPRDSQFELSVPYRFVARDETTDILGSIQSSQDSNGHGVGDIRVGVAKTLLRAGNGGPDLIGRVTWDTATGRPTDDGVALSFGFNELNGQLTALYRQDPMVFVGTVGYEYTFENNGIRPGDEFQFFLGTTIAVSPETSLSLGLDQVYRRALESNGNRIDGSDQLASSFTFGTSMIVGPRALLRLTAGIGLTDDAPDYSFGISLPIRFRSPID